ncbi:MOSC domain-containing protein [Desulforhopalus sp. 52FAK]
MKKINAISISDRKGMRKKNIQSTTLIEDFGLENDAHGGDWHRQVSFLAEESIQTMRDKGLDVVAGNFAENLTTEGVDLTQVDVGTHITIGETELIISQLGKICHTPCAIYHQAGDCVMPREGIFAVVARGGDIRVGDSLTILEKHSASAAIVSNTNDETKELKSIIENQFSPAFIRLDTINNKKGGTLAAIIEDLASTQKTDNIIVLDTTGELGLALTGLPVEKQGANIYNYKNSTIYHFRNSSPPFPWER